MNRKYLKLDLLVVAFLLASVCYVPGGRPGPPKRNPPEFRQANMLMLRFQDALAAEQWPEALILCSDQVRAKATEWASPKEFFTETMPIEHVLAQTFGCWSCGTNFYGIVLSLSEPDAVPLIQWFWAVTREKGEWVVDYPPVKLSEYVSKRKAAIHERDERVRKIREDVGGRAKGLSTRLMAASEQFMIGSPMVFRLELVNSGASPVDYMDRGIRFKPLSVRNEAKEPVDYVPKHAQITVQKAKITGGASVVLAEKIDINAGHEITKPGKYYVQFDSTELSIGQPVPHEEFGRFGENLSLSTFDFVSVTNKFPSNVVEIEVFR